LVSRRAQSGAISPSRDAHSRRRVEEPVHADRVRSSGKRRKIGLPIDVRLETGRVTSLVESRGSPVIEQLVMIVAKQLAKVGVGPPVGGRIEVASQEFARRRPVKAVHAPYETGQGLACQMPVAYSAMVRSLENLPELATLAITLLVQRSGSA